MDCSPPVHGSSLGKNTGVGCHVLLQGIFPTQGLNPGLPNCRQILYRLSHHGRPRISLRPHGLQPPRHLRPWDFPGKSTGVGCHCLLQGIFPTQGLNPGLPHCRQTLYPLSHQGSPRILEWVAYSFSREISQPRNRPGSPALQADSLPVELSVKPGQP
ncbi:unnamed protein product [Rangifer tarandus platyrhynchus]|uniref:Uncharacterized protein n=1 Tax=Rangifer tarandus platyrhynchus TaxID=3082113 RepID=A0AC59ZNU5_RANTA